MRRPILSSNEVIFETLISKLKKKKLPKSPNDELLGGDENSKRQSSGSREGIR